VTARSVALALALDGSLLCALAACGAPTRPLAETPVPSTDRDPAPFLPGPSAFARTGEPVGLTVSGGEEQARQLLVRLVLAMRDGDEPEITRMLAERIGHAAGAAQTSWTRGTMAHQLAIGAGASHLDPDAPFETLVDPTTIRVSTASAHFTAGLPAIVLATDLVVLFQPTTIGRRALSGLASGVIVVRPGPEPIVVAR
jgi:hypothetical protein